MRHILSILVENEGRTTSESMRAVAGMLEVRGLQTALLVSDPFHMLRLRDRLYKLMADYTNKTPEVIKRFDAA